MIEIQNKTEKMLKLEKQFGTSIEELLRKLYIDERMSYDDMTRHLNIATQTLHNWLQEAHIFSRGFKI